MKSKNKQEKFIIRLKLNEVNQNYPIDWIKGESIESDWNPLTEK